MSTEALTGTVGGVVHAALDGLAARHRAVADNVANVQTPGYRATEIDFETSLRAAIATGGGSSAAMPPVANKSTAPARPDGSNVNLETEILQDTETGLRYQMMVRALDDRFGLLRSALRTGGI